MKCRYYFILTFFILQFSACVNPLKDVNNNAVNSGTGIPTANGTLGEQQNTDGNNSSSSSVIATPQGSQFSKDQFYSYFPLISYNLVNYISPSGSPRYSINFLHPEFGCNWMGVAGQVFNSSGIPEKGLIIQVDGKMNGSNISALGLTGSTQAIGPGGYEIKISDRVSGSEDSLWIQVFSKEGQALSSKFGFDTYGDCQKNLTIINFKDNR